MSEMVPTGSKYTDGLSGAPNNLSILTEPVPCDNGGWGGNDIEIPERGGNIVPQLAKAAI